MGLKRLECLMIKVGMNELRMGFGSIRVLACTTLVNTQKMMDDQSPLHLGVINNYHSSTRNIMRHIRFTSSIKLLCKRRHPLGWIMGAKRCPLMHSKGFCAVPKALVLYLLKAHQFPSAIGAHLIFLNIDPFLPKKKRNLT